MIMETINNLEEEWHERKVLSEGNHGPMAWFVKLWFFLDDPKEESIGLCVETAFGRQAPDCHQASREEGEKQARRRELGCFDVSLRRSRATG